MDDENPYRAPQANTTPRVEPPGELSARLWRDGNLLVLRKDAVLPDRCVACNEPAEGRRWRQRFYWHPPVYFIVILLNPLIYAILALFVLTSARLELGVCARHERRRRHSLVVATLVACLGIAGIVATIVFREAGPAPLLASAWILSAGVVAAIVGRRLVRPKRIGNYFVWLKGVHPDFLAAYPDWLSRLTPYTRRRMLPATRRKTRKASRQPVGQAPMAPDTFA